jgi:CHAT domain-containing protein
VISSYTPSVKALGYTRSQIKRTQTNQPTHDQMLIAFMPETPQGLNNKTRSKRLTGVSTEEEKISEIVTLHVNLVFRTRPDADDVLGQLEKCQISHPACHGTLDLIDPSSSGLVLQRLASDGMLEQDCLSVYRISQQDQLLFSKTPRNEDTVSGSAASPRLRLLSSMSNQR